MLSSPRSSFSLSLVVAVLATLATPLLLSTPAFAEENDAYIRQALDRYFVLPQDARSLSTGGTSALTCSDASCIFMNPAGIAKVNEYQVVGSYGVGRISGDEFTDGDLFEQDESHGYGALAVPLSDNGPGKANYGTVVLAYSRYIGETNDGLNTTPDGHRRSLAYGLSVSDGFDIGYSLTFYDDQLKSDLADLHSHSRFLHTFGSNIDLGDGLTASAIFHLGIGQSDTEDYILKSDGLSHLREYSGAVGLTKDWGTTRVGAVIDYGQVRSRGNLTEVSDPVVIGGDEDGKQFNARIGATTPLYEKLFINGGVRYYWARYEFGRSDLRSLSGHIDAVGVSSGLGYTVAAGEWREITLNLGAEYLTTGHGDWEYLLSCKIPLAR